MNLTLVILAAGAGTRYGGLKPLAPIGPSGETLLEYSAFDALSAGFGRIVLVIRPESEPAFRQRLDSRMARRVPVAYVHQRLDDPAVSERPPAVSERPPAVSERPPAVSERPPAVSERPPAGSERPPAGSERLPRRVKPWGTGHAVLAAASEVGGPFAVVNADDFYGTESYVALSGFLTGARGDRVLAAVGFHVAETLPDAGAVSRALLEAGGDGRLRRIGEIFEVWRQDGRIVYRDGGGHERALDGDRLVSMNMWGFTPRLMPELRRHFADFLARPGREPGAEFLLPEVIQSLVSDGRFRVEVLAGSGEWCGITHRQDEGRARSVIASLVDRGRYPRELWA